MHQVSKWLRLLTISALTIAGCIAGVASPAAAGDPKLGISRETLQVLCVTLGGDYSEKLNPDRCGFTDSEILCQEGGCGYASRLENPPLRDECEYAGGIFGDRGKGIYACELREGVLSVDGTSCDVWSDQPMSLCAIEFRPHAEGIRVR